jgi:ubiquinone/menaquinone biosynthesis C-methylase UbiE
VSVATLAGDLYLAMGDAIYIHGTAAPEQARLVELNRLTNPTFLAFLRVQPGMQILEVGSGLGILACEVAELARGGSVVGLERSPEQMAAARPHSAVRYVQGDAHELPFAADSFDLVYCRYLLEHVADPLRAVTQMHCVVRPGGRLAVMENDISLVRFDPPCPAFSAVWSAFARYQWRLGGDAFIGRRLFRLLKEAGFERIELSLQSELHWSGSPDFVAWVNNLAGNLNSARAGLIESGLCTADQLAHATDELVHLAARTDATAGFAWNRALATK